MRFVGTFDRTAIAPELGKSDLPREAIAWTKTDSFMARRLCRLAFTEFGYRCPVLEEAFVRRRNMQANQSLERRMTQPRRRKLARQRRAKNPPQSNIILCAAISA